MRFWAALFFCLLALPVAAATLHFPTLTGRVVDDAHLLDEASIAQLDGVLQQREQADGTQLVVVTLPSLQGVEIEDYGYQLGRFWGIGQKGKNNGALLIVAPNERKVRIEVGYGLEGRLTDAASSVIINRIILPQFKQGNYATGVVQGTRAILAVLGGEDIEAHDANDKNKENIPLWWYLFIFLFISYIVYTALFRPKELPLLFGTMIGWNGGSGGGGFTGGGGSFGGGGSSGGW